MHLGLAAGAGDAAHGRNGDALTEREPGADERGERESLLLDANAIGVGAGLSTTVSNAAGPLMSIYMTSLGLEKTAFMGTTAWYFFIFNLTKIPMYLLLDWLTPAHPAWCRPCGDASGWCRILSVPMDRFAPQRNASR